mmetsp:Transcript_84903/g.181924  ORF Transcript_84903/g.181924 Transcript_84903/m.181924 type:complete len:235 (-) Transcript_84903:472-1176(-)
MKKHKNILAITGVRSTTNAVATTTLAQTATIKLNMVPLPPAIGKKSIIKEATDKRMVSKTTSFWLARNARIWATFCVVSFCSPKPRKTTQRGSDIAMHAPMRNNIGAPESVSTRPQAKWAPIEATIPKTTQTPIIVNAFFLASPPSVDSSDAPSIIAFTFSANKPAVKTSFIACIKFPKQRHTTNQATLNDALGISIERKAFNPRLMGFEGERPTANIPASPVMESRMAYGVLV